MIPLRVLSIASKLRLNAIQILFGCMLTIINKFKKLLIISGAAVVLVILASVAIRKAGVWLLVKDPLPDKVDVVFTFAGDRNRVDYSSEFMIKYSDSHWLLSDFKNGYINYISKKGFDLSRVTVVDTCVSTISEVKCLFGYLKEQQIKYSQKISVGLVSSPYHMRRIKLMVKSQARMKNVSFSYHPVPMNMYNASKLMYERWWRHKNTSEVVILEYQKILYFYLFDNK